MKTYSLKEGDYPHASTSIAQDGDSGNRKLKRDGTADPTSRTAGHARGLETRGQAMGRPAPGLSALWSPGAPTGRNDTTSDRHALWARDGAATALSLSAVWASVVPGQEPVRRVTRSNRDGALARSSAVGRLFVAVSSSQCHVEKAKFRADQCRRDPSTDQPAWPAAGGAAASGGRAGVLRCCPGARSSGAHRATAAGGSGWGMGVQSGPARRDGGQGGCGLFGSGRSADVNGFPHVFVERAGSQAPSQATPSA